MRDLKQSTAYTLMVFMTDSADHVAGKTGLMLTITASKAGAAFAAITPTVTERGSGWYSLALTTAHTDTLGDLSLHVTGTGADPSDVLCQIVAGALDADISSRLATAGYTAPNNAGITSILTAVDTEVAAILAAVDTEVAAIKARTDNLPADTAASITAIIGYVDEIESRLTSGRAALLDNLDAAVSSRLATAGYVAPDNASVAAILIDTAEIAALPTATAEATLSAAQATPIHADMQKTNGEDMIGTGTVLDKFRSHLVP